MWKKGELVWVRLNPSDSWIPGRILDPSKPLGILVSFFDLMEPRHVPKPCLRSFERDFETLVADSWRFRHLVNRALRRLAETNSSTAQILSFNRYTVDFNLSESLYEQVRESAKLMDHVEEPDWYLHPSNCIDLVPPTDLDLVPCSSSEQPVDKLVQICSLKLRNPLNNSGLKACETMARTSDHEDADRSKRCHWDQSICLRNSESPMAANDKAFLAKPVSFVVLDAYQNLACSNKELGSDYVGVAPAEKLQDLEVATAVENQIREVNNIRSIGVRRKASRDKASCNSKRRNKASQRSVSADKPQNLLLLKDKRFADPKCLEMKFLSTHGNLPSRSELSKRFSLFGKIDASRTNVNPEGSSAKVVFLHSIDAVTAYQFVKKIKLGRSKVVYRLGAFEEDIGVNKVSLSLKGLNSLFHHQRIMQHGLVDKEEGRSHLKVKFQMASNS